MPKIRGVILCGGQSSRMGTDKGLIKSSGCSWIQIAIGKISGLHLDVCLSVNNIQLNEYFQEFGNFPLIIDEAALQVKGPLTGILSVHLQYPNEDLFVLACDMPLMQPEILQELLSSYQECGDAQAYVFLNNNEPEPLCAIYTATGLAYILRLLYAKELSRHSIKFMLQQLNTATLPLGDHQKKYFRNFNTREELNNFPA